MGWPEGAPKFGVWRARSLSPLASVAADLK
jgi:hypothetical protein